MNPIKKNRLPTTRKEKEIWQVCDSIDSNKQSLTYFAIGEKLVEMGYKRGSNSDIRRYLKTWRKNQLSAQQEETVAVVVEQSIVQQQEIQMPLPWDLTKTITAPTQGVPMQQLIQFYQHHLAQFDRLLGVIENLKKENQLLRAKVKTLTELSKQAKPRYVYKQPSVKVSEADAI
jgi:hypothetical protein